VALAFAACTDENPQAEACATETSMKLKCPICKQPTDSETSAEFPFCSVRCREHDLGNWAAERYKVAAPMMDESELEETETNERAQPEISEDGDE
jgi:uncharacterized protein